MGTIQILLISAIDLFFQVIEFLILGTILLSWIPIGYNSPIGVFLTTMTTPILGPCKRLIDNSPLGKGMILDFSPVIALILLSLAKQVLQSLVIIIF